MKLIPILTMFLFSAQAMSQDFDNCVLLWHKYDSLSSNMVGLVIYENPPTLYSGLEPFYEKVKNEANDIDERGKVFIRFVVDTLGNAQCLKVMKSNNELLNAKALEIIEETKFSPATQQGKKVVAPMVLPITFGEPPKKKGKK